MVGSGERVIARVRWGVTPFPPRCGGNGVAVSGPVEESVLIGEPRQCSVRETPASVASALISAEAFSFDHPAATAAST